MGPKLLFGWLAVMVQLFNVANLPLIKKKNLLKLFVDVFGNVLRSCVKRYALQSPVRNSFLLSSGLAVKIIIYLQIWLSESIICLQNGIVLIVEWRCCT